MCKHRTISTPQTPCVCPPLRDADTGFRPPVQYRQKQKGCFRIPLLLPVAGVEPARCRHQRILSPPRLPIPTHRHIYRNSISQTDMTFKMNFNFFDFSFVKVQLSSHYSAIKIVKRIDKRLPRCYNRNNLIY